MKEFMLLVGAGIGFVAGSRAGNGPYKKLASKARKVAKRPEVQDAVGRVKSTAAYKAADLTAKPPSKTDGVHDVEPVEFIVAPVPEPTVSGGPWTEGQ
jgi:hypothetical protein